MSFYGEYVSVAEKKEKALRAIKTLRKKDPTIEPVIIEGKAVSNSWWGKAWNLNLESYADYSNRIKRGKSYVKQYCVIDLKITSGLIKSLVKGSPRKPYEISIEIASLSDEKWNKISKLCENSIDSLEQLIEGSFPKELEVLFKEKKYGLFPSPDEISFSCNCPDYASMCKHIAATLYGVGARFDENPLLFFELRNIDVNALMKKTVEEKLESMLRNLDKKSDRVISEDKVSDLFNI